VDKRPIFLNLLKIYFPITAIISILHRVSGVALFFSLPILLCGLQMSLGSIDTFNQLMSWQKTPFGQVILFLVQTAICYHSIAGLRHLVMDFGIGETKEAGVFSSYLVLALTVLTMVGWYLC